jgi:Holliday junction DNA helicase RuvA
MALPMLATGSISMIEEAIETENINYLKKFPKIGDKVARQLVLDLKGKLNVINTGLFKREDHSGELTDALIGLGYKQADVKKIVSKVDSTLDLENQIKEALKLLLK